MKKWKAVILINDTTYTYNLRREIIQRLMSEGFEVVVVCTLLLLQDELKSLGCRLVGVDTQRNGTNPIEDIKLFTRYVKILRMEKPDIVLSYNIKPNIYGGMACRLLGIRYMPNITGLGKALEIPGKLKSLTTQLYRIGVAGAECVFFQNSENVQFFKEYNMLNSKSRLTMLPGSGVSLTKHQPKRYPHGAMVNFLYVARVMKEKGIDLYLACAKEIHECYNNTLFHICGMCDDPAYLRILKKAEEDGYVKYHGEQEEMEPFFSMAHCVVHPSYYPEGMSNVLLEAAANARPIIATDRSGCRETVDDGRTGFVVPIKNKAALIGAVDKFMHLTWEERRDMGLAGRQKVEKEFDRQIVVNMVINEVCKK